MNTLSSLRLPAARALRTWLLLLTPLMLVLSVRAAGAGTPGEERWLAPPEKVYPVNFTGPRPRLVQAAARIGAVTARQQFNVDGTGLAAAVLDTGLRTTHQDFPAGKILEQRNFTNDNGGSDTNALDGQGHGSHVAGIIAANGVHTGIAPGAKLVPVKVLPNFGQGQGSWLSGALDYLIDNHSRLNITVANLSLGSVENFQFTFSDSLRSKIAQLRQEKVAVVISAGNSFKVFNSVQGMAWPAIHPESISVGAVYDANFNGSYTYPNPLGTATAGSPIVADQFCPFSQRLHPSVSAASATDIFAPGADILSTGIDNDGASAQLHGTSQAAPVVSGVILLMQQYHLRQTGQLPTIDDIESWLISGAVELTDGENQVDNVVNTGLAFPRIDALGALQAMQADLGGEGALMGRITANGNGLEGVSVSIGGQSTLTDADGEYLFEGLATGQFTVTPSKPPYVFNPTSRTVNVAPNATNVDFTGVIPTYTVRGAVRVGPAAVVGAVVSAGGQTATTQSNGTYTLTGLTAGTYTVAVVKSGYRFAPLSTQVTVGPSQENVNFSATRLLSVGGTIKANKLPMAGVTVTLEHASGNRTATTDANGAYTFDDVAAGTYKLVPAREDYLFTPANRTVRVTTRSVTTMHFTGALIPDLQSIAAGPLNVKGGRPGFVSVLLNGNTPVTMKVALVSSHPEIVKVPALVTIPKGRPSARPTLPTKRVQTATPVTITATLNGEVRTSTFTVTP